MLLKLTEGNRQHNNTSLISFFDYYNIRKSLHVLYFLWILLLWLESGWLLFRLLWTICPFLVVDAVLQAGLWLRMNELASPPLEIRVHPLSSKPSSAVVNQFARRRQQWSTNSRDEVYDYIALAWGVKVDDSGWDCVMVEGALVAFVCQLTNLGKAVHCFVVVCQLFLLWELVTQQLLVLSMLSPCKPPVTNATNH